MVPAFQHRHHHHHQPQQPYSMYLNHPSSLQQQHAHSRVHAHAHQQPTAERQYNRPPPSDNNGAAYRTVMVPMQVPIKNVATPSPPRSSHAQQQQQYHHHAQHSQHQQQHPYYSQAQPTHAQSYGSYWPSHHNHSHNHHLHQHHQQQQSPYRGHPAYVPPLSPIKTPTRPKHHQQPQQQAQASPHRASTAATQQAQQQEPSSENVMPSPKENKDELDAANALMNLAPSSPKKNVPKTTASPSVFRPITFTNGSSPSLSSSSFQPIKGSHHDDGDADNVTRFNTSGTVTPNSSFESPITKAKRTTSNHTGARLSKHRRGNSDGSGNSGQLNRDYASEMSSVAGSDADSRSSTPTMVSAMSSPYCLPIHPSPNNNHATSSSSGTAEASPIEAYHGGSVSLSLAEDDDVLSPLHCFMRRYCVEAFAATPEDVSTPRYGKSHGVKVVVGQVGIRCLYCKHRSGESRPERAVCYPSSLRNIYHSIETWQRRHSLICPDIAPWVKKSMAELMQSSKSRAGGRRQYWEDSAKRLGMINTPSGVRFTRAPGLIAPTKRVPPPAVADQVSKRPSMPVVELEDRQLITDYLFVLMDQMQTCYFTEEDRSGGRSKVKSNPVGFPGIMCKHCHGKAGFGRYFPTSANALALANSDRNIFNHIQKCRRCPTSVKMELNRLTKAESSKNRRGLRKLFFRRVWDRVHGSAEDS
mmetsp:Transcript_26745/g.74935  ORF Transcript_26745/g.74935 Transcript_26745/m.74935 type:complete len:698 (+) Transcript_26745:160-2253(+)